MFQYIIKRTLPIIFVTLIACQPAAKNTSASTETTAESLDTTSNIKNAILKNSPTPSSESIAVTEPVLPTSALPAKGKTEPLPTKNTKQPSMQPENTTSETEIPEVTDMPVSHEGWDKLLRQYVSATGKVNYKGLQKSKAELNAYLDYLAKNPVQEKWSKSEKMAYWINAYNAFTVKLIVDNYPTTSITKLHDGKPWDVKWIKLGDKTYSLNNLEHDILRPQYKDARIHFAVNCAAQSCPPLLHRAWTADNLNKYLDQQTKTFINNPVFNKISANEVQISKIFEWYAEDFGNIIEYLNQYSTTKINANATVKYLEYDWTLNE